MRFRDINLEKYLCGENIKLIDDDRTATRVKSFKGGLLMCNKNIKPDELFQILIVKCNKNYAGSLRIGVISYVPKPPLPSEIKDLNVNKNDIWYFTGM